MLNKELMSPEERYAFLVKKYKEHDRKRQEYIDSLEHEIANLRYEVEDLKSEIATCTPEEYRMLKERIAALEAEIKAQGKGMNTLQNKIRTLTNIHEYQDVEQLSPDKKSLQILQLKKLNKKQNEEVSRLRQTIRTMVYDIAQDHPEKINDKVLQVADIFLGTPPEEDAGIMD